jgi:integrase
LHDIKDSDIRKFQARLNTATATDKRLSPRRINTIVQLLRSILSQKCKAGELRQDPSLSVRRLSEDKADINPLSTKELELALKNIDLHYRPLFTTLAFTGARPNELLALRWNDIDWQNELMDIKKGRVRGKEGEPKTKAAKRTIPLAPQVVQVIRHLKKSAVYSIDGYVFTKPNGEPIDKHLDRIWSRALKKAGLKHRPSYQLRHTFATHCIINGLPLPYIAKILGHSTIDVLVRHYAGWINDATKQEDDKLKEMLKKLSATEGELASKVGSFSGSITKM